MTTLIVDDDAVFRTRLQKVLDGETRTAASTEEGVREAGSWQPSVVLLDNRFDGDERSGIDLIPDFKAVCPRAKIVIMSSYLSVEEERQAVQQGAFTCAKTNVRLLRAVASRARACVPSVFVAPAAARRQ